MKETPLQPMRVSVIIPTHNRARVVGEAVRSALENEPHVREVLVVDDGSSDDTESVIRSLADDRVHYIRRENSGPGASRNAGLELARGDFIQFLDSDDTLAPGALESLLSAQQAQPDRLPFGDAAVYGQNFDGQPVYQFTLANRSGRLLPELAFYNQGTILSCLFPRQTLKDLGGFTLRPEFHFCEDYDLALRLALRYRFQRVGRVTYRIRMHDENRHRPNLERVHAASLACASLHLGTWRTPHLYLRIRSLFLTRQATARLARGERAAARRLFLAGVLHWPAKREAWAGLFKCLRHAPHTPD